MNYQNHQPPPFQQPVNSNKTSLGMDGNVAALLSYIIGIVAIVVLIAEKENRFARYHALQALLFHASFTILFFVLFFLLFIFGFLLTAIGIGLGDAGAIVGVIGSVIMMIVWFIFIIAAPLLILGGILYGAIQSYNGKWFKFPIIGKLSAKWLGISF